MDTLNNCLDINVIIFDEKGLNKMFFNLDNLIIKTCENYAYNIYIDEQDFAQKILKFHKKINQKNDDYKYFGISKILKPIPAANKKIQEQWSQVKNKSFPYNEG